MSAGLTDGYIAMPRYSVRSILLLMTLAAGVAAVGGWLIDLPIASLPKWLFLGFPESLPFFVPGLITQLVLLFMAVLYRPSDGKRLLLSTIAASLACWGVMASPGICAWYTWEVVGDHTANIGAGLLLMAQVLGAPVAAVLVWCGCAAVESGLAPKLGSSRKSGQMAAPGGDSQQSAENPPADPPDGR